MKMHLLILAVVVFLSPLAAKSSTLSTESLNQAGFSSLTEAQKAAIIKEVVDKNETNKMTPDTPAIEKIDAWVDLGTKIGKSLSGAAKEAGVAVNDFAKTPVGVLTTGLIVWKMVGNSVYHFVGGILIWVIGFAVVRGMFKRATTKETFDKDGVLTGSERDTIDGEAFVTYVVANAAVLIGGIIAIFTY